MLQKPHLYGAVLTLVGVLDMLRYHLYTIGRYWVPEYGDINNKDEFLNMYKYSPLHNVKENVQYPPLMFIPQIMMIELILHILKSMQLFSKKKEKVAHFSCEFKQMRVIMQSENK